MLMGNGIGEQVQPRNSPEAQRESLVAKGGKFAPVSAVQPSGMC